MVFAGGDEGRTVFTYKCAVRAAELRGTSLVQIPGNHSAIKYPEVTAQLLCQLLEASA
jgi:hypothetical protein